MRARALILAGVLWCVAAPARADLIDLGSGLIYDTEQDLTWLQDVMYTRTAGLDADGLFLRSEVTAFVDAFSYAGSDDWRLPISSGGIFNASDSEVSTVLRGLGWRWETSDPLMSFPDYQNGGSGPFVNFGPGITLVWLRPTASTAGQYWGPFGDTDYAEADLDAAIWFVHDGKLDPSYSASVPEPSTTLLIGIGVAALGLRRRRQRTV
jgi:hypothetical protein